jgi:hypothetical protein
MRVLAKLQRVGVPARRTVCAYVLASSTLLPISLLLLARSILQLAQHLQLTYAKNRLIATGTYRAFAFFVFLTLAHGRLQGSYKGLYSSRLANLVELGILNLLQLVFRIPLVYDTEATHDAVWRSTCLILTGSAHFSHERTSVSSIDYSDSSSVPLVSTGKQVYVRYSSWTVRVHHMMNPVSEFFCSEQFCSHATQFNNQMF